jgi:hypothetical protein
MKEELDNKFTDRIKEVFENREEPYNSNDWKKLLAKKPMNDVRHFGWSYSKYAAIVIIFVFLGGIGSFVFFENSQNLTVQIDKPALIDKKKDVIKPDSIDKTSAKQVYITLESKKRITPIYNKKNTLKQATKTSVELAQKKEYTSNTNLYKREKEPIKHVKGVLVFNDNNKYNLDNLFFVDHLLFSNPKYDHYDLAIDYPKISTLNLELEKIAKFQKNDDILKDAINVQNQEELLASTSPSTFELQLRDDNSITELSHEKTNKNKKITVGLAVSSIVSYNQGSQNSNVSLGVGALLDIPIYKKFDINTGILVTNQKINLQENSLVVLANGSQLKSKKAVLTGLDIPINLKYNFSMNNSDMFLAVGLSSVSYIKEDIESTFQQSSTIYSESINEFGTLVRTSDIVNTFRIDKESKGSLTNFSFGNILNFSFGVELPFKNSGQSIILEPFFKYALKSISSENIDLSSVGLNLKLNLKTRNFKN